MEQNLDIKLEKEQNKEEEKYLGEKGEEDQKDLNYEEKEIKNIEDIHQVRKKYA